VWGRSSMAKRVNPYRIELTRLAEGSHEFAFELSTSELAPEVPNEEATLPELSEARAEITLRKSERLLDLTVRLTGWAELECDRCLQSYPFQIVSEGRLIYTHDKSVEEADDELDVHYLPASTATLDLQQELYDRVALQIPLRRIPPDCPGPRCPPAVLELLARGEQAVIEAETGASEESDDRWDALKNLRDTN